MLPILLQLSEWVTLEAAKLAADPEAAEMRGRAREDGIRVVRELLDCALRIQLTRHRVYSHLSDVCTD